jgi:hypothetical protein
MPIDETAHSCVSDRLRAASSDPEQLVELVRSVRSVKADTLKLSDVDPKSCVRVVIHASLGDNPSVLPKGEALDAFVSTFNTAEALRDAVSKQARSFIGAAESIGTHSDKVPDPTRGNGSFFAEATATVVGFVAGLSTRDRSKIAGAGNAADSRAMALFSKKVAIGNRVITVAENLVEGGVFFEVLLESGTPADLLDQVRSTLKQRMAGPSDAPVECETKVLILPNGEGGDTLVSPVHSYQTFDTFSKRLKAMRDAHAHISTRSHNVGGSKPQNAGILNNAYNGTHQLLVGVPPKGRRFSDAERIQVAAAGGSLLRNPSTEAVDAINAVMEDRRNNVDIRSRLLDLLDEAVGEIVDQLVLAMRLTDDGDLVVDQIADQAERELVDRGWHGLDPDQRLRILDGCHLRISASVAHNVDDRLMRQRIEVAVVQALENYDMEDAA